MKHVRSRWSSALGVALLCLCLPPTALAIPTVYIDPGSTTVDVGDTLELQVMINADADTISGYRIIFRFNPGVLEFVEAIEGSLFANSGYMTWFHVEEESLGTWEVFDVVFPSMSYVVAPGELARLRFWALANGYSRIEFLYVKVTDILRYTLDPLTWRDGFVWVGTGLSVESEEAVRDWDIGYPFPNPSRGQTHILLAKDWEAQALGCKLGVYDARGRLIRELSADLGGSSDLVWDGRDYRGIDVPSGAYFFRLVTPEKVVSRKVILVR